MLKRLIGWWKGDAKVRFAARTIGVAVAGYLVSGAQVGFDSWHSFVTGLGSAVVTAILGLLGLEPKVGLNKTNVS